MGKVEIKIRKKILTPDNLQQYRNYPALLKKYERNKRFKRALRIFLYSLALTIFVLALIFLGMWKVLLDKKQETINPKKIHTYLIVRPDRKIDTVLFEFIGKSINDSMYMITYEVHPILEYRFPINFASNSASDFTLLSTKNFEISGKNYLVNKYLMNHPKTTNDEVYYFYSPDFGILHVKSMMWSNRTLLSTQNPEKDLIIKFLLSEMQNDQEFYGLSKP